MLDLDKNLFEKLLILHLPSRCWLGKKRPALIFLVQLLLILCVQIFFHFFRHLEFDHKILLYSLILDFESWRVETWNELVQRDRVVLSPLSLRGYIFVQLGTSLKSNVVKKPRQNIPTSFTTKFWW